ncbi:DUF4147 domain-containing protein [Candidatus Azambacteria bacterium]|nr:DUF4147 domain-containing protein [Candidatus Azambacteria bacterium]
MIKNIKELSITPERKILLEILDHGLEQTRSEIVLGAEIKRSGEILTVQKKNFDLSKYERIIITAIGKAAGDACKFLESVLEDKITKGYCIDVSDKELKMIEHTTGTHPYPSEKNAAFSKAVVSILSNLKNTDLVIAVISGGGSSLFCLPYETECEAGVEIFKELTKKGAAIEEINTVRKHLSVVKGGGLAKIAYPATIIGLLFSDVPGNDIGMIASGPTVKDKTTIKEAKNILKEYEINYAGELFETPKEERYFKNVHNFLICSNKTTIIAMLKKAKELGIFAKALGRDIQMDANTTGKFLLENTKPGEILLAGGETTVKIKGSGKGGRNQQVALSTLEMIEDGNIVISCASDGYDYTEAAGAIADGETLKKSKKEKLDIKKYINGNDSFNFFEKTKDQIITGKTGMNVSDIFLAYKKPLK